MRVRKEDPDVKLFRVVGGMKASESRLVGSAISVSKARGRCLTDHHDFRSNQPTDLFSFLLPSTAIM